MIQTIRLHQVLAAVMVLAGATGFMIGMAGYLATEDDLADLLLWLIALPSLPPLVLGVMLWRGSRLALWGLRLFVVVALLAGAWLHVAVGLQVFSKAEFAIPFIWFCLLWLALSFRCRLA